MFKGCLDERVLQDKIVSELVVASRSLVIELPLPNRKVKIEPKNYPKNEKCNFPKASEHRSQCCACVAKAESSYF